MHSPLRGPTPVSIKSGGWGPTPPVRGSTSVRSQGVRGPASQVVKGQTLWGPTPVQVQIRGPTPVHKKASNPGQILPPSSSPAGVAGGLGTSSPVASARVIQYAAKSTRPIILSNSEGKCQVGILLHADCGFKKNN